MVFMLGRRDPNFHIGDQSHQWETLQPWKHRLVMYQKNTLWKPQPGNQP